MRKLKQAILYECATKIRPVAIFYAIECAITAAIFAIVSILTGGKHMGSNGLEISSVVFVSVLGILSYREDFKELIQNGYTRKYIYLSNICMFLVVCGTMALIDTIVGNGIHHFTGGTYFTLYGVLYGYGDPLANWLWLTALYLMVCSVFYLGALVISKVGKLVFLFIGVGISGLILLVGALFQFVLSAETVQAIALFCRTAMGFLGDGSIYVALPVLTFLILAALLNALSYGVIRRTELK